jgi:hypothetical protein
MSAEFPVEIDLRAHHLYSLARQYRASGVTRSIRGIKLALLGYRDNEFKDHLTEVIGGIINCETERVRITDSYDEICKKCPQKRDEHCRVAGIEWPSEFLSSVDREVAENSSLTIGEVYNSDELIQRMDSIRKGIRRTFLKLPELLKTVIY